MQMLFWGQPRCDLPSHLHNLDRTDISPMQWGILLALASHIFGHFLTTFQLKESGLECLRSPSLKFYKPAIWDAKKWGVSIWNDANEKWHWQHYLICGWYRPSFGFTNQAACCLEKVHPYRHVFQVRKWLHLVIGNTENDTRVAHWGGHFVP